MINETIEKGENVKEKIVVLIKEEKCIYMYIYEGNLAVSNFVNRAFKFLFKMIQFLVRNRSHVFTSVASHVELKTPGFFPQYSQFTIKLFLQHIHMNYDGS